MFTFENIIFIYMVKVSHYIFFLQHSTRPFKVYFLTRPHDGAHWSILKCHSSRDLTLSYNTAILTSNLIILADSRALIKRERKKTASRLHRLFYRAKIEGWSRAREREGVGSRTGILLSSGLQARLRQRWRMIHTLILRWDTDGAERMTGAILTLKHISLFTCCWSFQPSARLWLMISTSNPQTKHWSTFSFQTGVKSIL